MGRILSDAVVVVEMSAQIPLFQKTKSCSGGKNPNDERLILGMPKHCILPS
jgi:hypothetical protein